MGEGYPNDSGTESFLDAPSDRPTTSAVVATTNGAIVGNQKSKIYYRPDCRWCINSVGRSHYTA